MAGRTHLQHALRLTFGLKCAVWLQPVIAHVERVDQLRPRVELVQSLFAVASPRSRPTSSCSRRPKWRKSRSRMSRDAAARPRCRSDRPRGVRLCGRGRASHRLPHARRSGHGRTAAGAGCPHAANPGELLRGSRREMGPWRRGPFRAPAAGNAVRPIWSCVKQFVPCVSPEHLGKSRCGSKWQAPGFWISPSLTPSAASHCDETTWSTMRAATAVRLRWVNGAER
jgi:hypothetical protein